MDIFKVDFGESVLLVGEGNFSFSVDFVNLNSPVLNEDKINHFRSVEIVSSCFESDNVIFANKKRNADFLLQKGCTVLYNVDATKLEENPIIRCKKFTKIIFQFPHAGGKMKIHLNRKLLASFFLSAKNVLRASGVVLVTLCDGQGGTGADKNQRQWNNSWKVVEMAAEGDFVLKNVIPFQHEYFLNYVNIGFRSLEKGFNTKNALVHVFKLSGLPHIINMPESEVSYLFEPDVISTKYGTVNISKVYSEKISQDPFGSKNSPQNYVLELILNVSKTIIDKEVNFMDDPIICGSSCQYLSADEFINDFYMNLRNDEFINSLTMFKCFLLNNLSGNFHKKPVCCELVCVGEESDVFALKVISNLCEIFNFPEKLNDHVSNASDDHVSNGRTYFINGLTEIEILRVNTYSSRKYKFFRKVSTIVLDNLVQFLFQLDCWQALWAKGSKIEHGGIVKVLTPCLFPPTFIFDLSFSVSGEYEEQKFFLIFWHLCGNFVLDIELISVYEPPEKAVKNFCYRIKYRSYEIPLFRKRVIDIQRDIVGRTLEKMMNVIVL